MLDSIRQCLVVHVVRLEGCRVRIWEATVAIAVDRCWVSNVLLIHLWSHHDLATHRKRFAGVNILDKFSCIIKAFFEWQAFDDEVRQTVFLFLFRNRDEWFNSILDLTFIDLFLWPRSFRSARFRLGSKTVFLNFDLWEFVIWRRYIYFSFLRHHVND